MPMTADKLRVYLASKDLAVDGDPIPQRTADAGGTVETIVDAGITEATDYWNGALGWFDGNTVTAALCGKFFHVRDWNLGTTTLTLSKELPAIPVTGDTFRLVRGGKIRSSQEAFGMTADGALPEVETVAGLNITGLTVKKVAGMLGEDLLTLKYDFANDLLFAKIGTNPFGVGLNVSANVVDGHVYVNDGIGFVRVDVVVASLPGSDQEDDWDLAYPERTLTPDYEGYETKDSKGGKTRYRLEVAKNLDPTGMTGLTVQTGRPAGAQTAIAAGESLGLAAGAFAVVDATGWPASGFWALNTTKNDCRYVDFRSGLELNCLGVEWAKLPFDAGLDEVFPGDFVEGVTSLANAYVDQVVLTSGSWAGLDAAGYLLLKRVVGTFLNNESLEVAAVPKATANGASVRGLRDKIAVAWAAADIVLPMPDVDVGTELPVLLAFTDPLRETDAPAGIVFQAAYSTATALALGNLASGGLVGVWRREWIVYDTQPRDGMNPDSTYVWT